MIDLAVIAAILALVAAARHRITALPMTAPMLFVAAGVLLGPDVAGLLKIELESESVALLAEFTLALLLFSDAARIDVRRLRAAVGIPIRLLGIGLPLTIALGTVLSAWLLTDLTWVEAALVAAVLAPTDAALGEAVVTNLAVPVRIRQALNVESGLNDGLVVPAVVILLSLAAGRELESPGRLAVDALAEIGLGLAIGVTVSFLMARLVGWAMDHSWSDAEGYRLVALAAAVGAFAGATAAGGNGFIAAFVCGLLVRSFLGDHVREHTELTEDVAQIGAAATFVVFGALLVWPAFGDVTIPIALCAVGTLTVGRMLPVWIALFGSGLKAPTVAFIGWFGPRGLASMVFGLLVIQEEQLVGRGDLFSIIVIVIVVSVVLHGITAAPWAARYADWFRRHGVADMEESVMVEAAPVRGQRTG